MSAPENKGVSHEELLMIKMATIAKDLGLAHKNTVIKFRDYIITALEQSMIRTNSESRNIRVIEGGNVKITLLNIVQRYQFPQEIHEGVKRFCNDYSFTALITSKIFNIESIENMFQKKYGKPLNVEFYDTGEAAEFYLVFPMV